MSAQTLYRPVGIKELELIAASDWKSFPPRLDWQPIFYPVLNEPYASQIAKQWNTEDEFSGYCGIVTVFDVEGDYAAKYAPQNVGSEMHNELWVPAEELDEFNKHIINEIKVANVFFGNKFTMPTDSTVIETLSKFQQP